MSPEQEPQQQSCKRAGDETQELRHPLETATDGVVILKYDGTIRSITARPAMFNYDGRSEKPTTSPSPCCSP